MKFNSLSNNEVIEQLRRLDPIDGNDPESESKIWKVVQTRIKMDGFDGNERHPDGTPSRSYLLIAAVFVGVIAIVGGVLVVGRQATPIPPTKEPTNAQVVNPKYTAVIKASTPLAIGKTLSCDGVPAPVEIEAMPGGAETGTSASSRALRAFITADPWKNLDPAHTGDWIRISDDSNKYVFGQRHGAAGIGVVVTFTKDQSGAIKTTSTGSCDIAFPQPNERTATIDSTTTSGDVVTVTWQNSTCTPNGPTLQKLVRVEQLATLTGTHLLVVTTASAAAAATSHATVTCAGVGVDSTSTVKLTSTPAGGKIYDDAHIPALVITHG